MTSLEKAAGAERRLDWRPAARGLAIPALLLAGWLFYGSYGGSTGRLVSLTEVASTAWRLQESGELWRALIRSLTRYLCGLLIGAVVGVTFGALIGLWAPFRKSVEPSFHAIKHISMYAWIPLIMTWFGLGEESKLVFISVAAFLPVALNTIEGVNHVHKDMVEVARLFKLSRWQMFVRIVLPSALPSMFTGLYLAVIYAWLATLGAEYLLVANGGVGDLLIEGRENFWIGQIVVGIAITAVVGVSFSHLVSLIERRLLRWHAAVAGRSAR